MLLDFSVDWQWIIGGTDVSPFVETWELAREQPDISTPAWWRGKLVLRPVVGRDLNLDPLTNSLWQQGTSCSLAVAGYLVFTGSILLAYYDEWNIAPRLELEVGDVLAAKNHRQVIPLGEYDAQLLLATLGIPGVALAGDKVEISTDLTSPVKVLQELTWVTGLKEGLPVTLFTRPDGHVDHVSPQEEILLTRTLEEVSDFTRQRPALEIPGSVITSASLTYLVQPSALASEEASKKETVLVSQQGDTAKITYLDPLGRPVREITYENSQIKGEAWYRYSFDDESYEIIKWVYIWTQPFEVFPYERTIERGKRAKDRTNLGTFSTRFFDGKVTAQKKTIVYWPDFRFFPTAYGSMFLAYLAEEYEVWASSYILPSSSYIASPHLVKLITRAKGTTQDSDTLSEALTLLPATTEITPNQEIRFPDWAQMPQTDKQPKLERVTDTLSEEVTVMGFTGPPVYLNVPWLSITVEDDPASRWWRQIEDLRQRIRYALRAAATWMAVEIAGRAFARRIKMPVPSEWLGDPRPWTLAKIGNEVLWLVGETLRGTAQGVEFEATGILAGRPNTIPPGELPPGMIPAFIPLITVAPTRFPQVGIGCAMSAGEVVTIPGDPWLGMAVEIEYEVSASAGTSTMVGIGVGEPAEAWLGLTADATYEVEGGEDDEDDSGSETEGLTLEAEDGLIERGIVVYDVDASSCYAVEAVYNYLSVDFSVDSTSLTWERPIRLRVIYKSAGDATIDVYVSQGEDRYPLTSFEVSATEGYTGEELVISTSEEPFDGITIDVEQHSSEFRLDAIQLAPATGDWPPLNPCSD